MCVIVALSVLLGYAALSQRQLELEVNEVLADLGTAAQRMTAEEFVDHIDRRKDAYSNIYVLLAQRNKVRTLAGGEQFQTRWRAGTLRYVEWPHVQQTDLTARPAPNWIEKSAGGQAIVSDWVTVTASRGAQNGIRLPIKLQARYAYFPERLAIGEPGLLLVVGRDEESGEAIRQPVIIAGIALAFMVPVFVAFSSLYTAQFVGSKIDEISETSMNIIGGDLSQRVPVGAKDDEFNRLSQLLNRMLDQNQRLLNGMKEVSDNIAHDLKTPLYRLRSRIELALIDVDAKESPTGSREALEVALAEADHLLATFNALHSIARLEAGLPREGIKREDVCVMLRDIADLYEPAAEERGLRLKTLAPPGLFIMCNRELIVQALSNLVDNALKYSSESTDVTLSARNVEAPQGTGRAVEICVSDQGPGIPSEDRERVLKRFVRLERGRGAPGSGLGLSLVAAVAQLHEAGLALEDGSNGQGLAVRLLFPAA